MRIIKVKNPQQGVEVCKKLLYEIASKTSVLFLSGGSTPKTLYEILAKEQKLKAGAVALIDERFIQNQESRIKNYELPKGTNQLMIEQTTKDYDETVRYLFNYFPKNIGILGIGVDGHTAGIPAGRIKNQELRIMNATDLVTSFNNFPAEQRERITLTFLGLSKLDQIIVLVFGKDKKKALKLMFQDSSLAEIPSRFLTQPEITNKVTLITDQEG